MTLSARASEQVPGIAPLNRPSHVQAWNLSINFQGLDSVGSFCVAVGRAASTPATFAGLTAPDLVGPFDVNDFTFTFIGGAYTGRISWLTVASGGTAEVDSVWVCLFDFTAAVVGGDHTKAPTLVLGPFLLA
jgi:hypothetical protein